MGSLARILESGLDAHPYSTLEPGSAVRIIGGPLSGVSGQLCSVRDEYKLVITITLLQRAVCVLLPKEWVVRGDEEPGDRMERMAITGKFFRYVPASMIT